MEDKVTLTARELFFLGRCMDAVYIDYAYIAAMPDIQKFYALHEQRALEALEDLELIEEDFSGNVLVTDGARELFRPVFFGGTESRLDNGKDCRVHILDGAMTLGCLEDGSITFRRVSERELRALLWGDVRVQCARAGQGFFEKTFTAAQLTEPDALREAIELLKGEIDYGVS